jgi:hypothetical protein
MDLSILRELQKHIFLRTPLSTPRVVDHPGPGRPRATTNLLRKEPQRPPWNATVRRVRKNHCREEIQYKFKWFLRGNVRLRSNHGAQPHRSKVMSHICRPKSQTDFNPKWTSMNLSTWTSQASQGNTQPVRFVGATVSRAPRRLVVFLCELEPVQCKVMPSTHRQRFSGDSSACFENNYTRVKLDMWLL